MPFDPRRLPIDMPPNGPFRGPPRAPVTSTIITVAVILAVVAGGLAVAALALWFALSLIPIVFLAVVIAVATIRFKLWQARRRARAFHAEAQREPPFPPQPYRTESFRRDREGVWRQ